MRGDTYHHQMENLHVPMQLTWKAMKVLLLASVHVLFVAPLCVPGLFLSFVIMCLYIYKNDLTNKQLHEEKT